MDVGFIAPFVAVHGLFLAVLVFRNLVTRYVGGA